MARDSSKFNKASGSKARSGYALRLAKKPKNQLDDVYEFSTDSRKLGRRAKIGMDLDRDEDLSGGVPDDEEERSKLRARLIGENEDDEQIDSADDEDLDSDAAFDESDDDQYAGFFKKDLVRRSISFSPACANLGAAV